MMNIEQQRAAAISRHQARVAESEAAAELAKTVKKMRSAGKHVALIVSANLPLVRVGGNSLHELREDIFDNAANTARFNQYDACMMGGEPFANWN